MEIHIYKLLLHSFSAYWFFTGYQDNCALWTGSHNSDWEHIVVKVIIDYYISIFLCTTEILTRKYNAQYIIHLLCCSIYFCDK